jgi:hypothetical protein
MGVDQAREELGNIRNQPFMTSTHKDRGGASGLFNWLDMVLR